MSKTAKPNDWETQMCLQKNRLVGRSYFVPYAERVGAAFLLPIRIKGRIM